MNVFDVVRNQIRSGLENQRQEDTIREQKTELVDVSYFGTLMTILETRKDDEILTSCVYLLSLLFPVMNHRVLKMKFGLISNVFSGLLETYLDNAAIVKSLVQCYESLLIAQDINNWNDQNSLNLFNSLLMLTLDERPKVRKRSVDGIKRIIASPPSPSLSHPGTLVCIDFTTTIFEEYLEHSKGQKFKKDENSNVLDTLVFIKLLMPVFAKQSSNDKVAKRLDNLIKCLLTLPVKASGTGDSILTSWVFQTLESLLEFSDDTQDSLSFSVVYSLVENLLEMTPHENDQVLVPVWLVLMMHGFARLGSFISEYESEPNGSHDISLVEFAKSEYSALHSAFFTRIFKTFFDTSIDIKSPIVEAAGVLLSSLIESGISGFMLTQAYQKKENSDFYQIINCFNEGLTNINFRNKWGTIFNFTSTLFKRLGNKHLPISDHILKMIMNFRDDKAYVLSFPYKEELESCLHVAIQSMGIQPFLNVAPLNIEAEGGFKRPYLLSTIGKALETPMIVSFWDPFSILGPHSMGYYVTELVPLAERMFLKSGTLKEQNRSLEAKLFETLGIQIWDLFPLLCSNMPFDLEKYFGKLAPVLGKILTTNPHELFPNLPSDVDLRPVVCKGLDQLLTCFKLFATVEDEEGDDEEKLKWKKASRKVGKSVMEKFKVYVNRFLSALCNLYTNFDTAFVGLSRGQALQTVHERATQYYEGPIRHFLEVANSSDINNYYLTLIKTITDGTEKDELKLYSIYDLLLVFLPFLPDEYTPESSLILTYQLLVEQVSQTDSTIQKKTYKALNTILERVPIELVDLPELFSKLLQDEVVSKVTSGAYRLRCKVLEQIITECTNAELLNDVIPQALPEIMLATKEANEKTREAAFECILVMASKIKELKPIDGVKDFLMMVTAGLGGESSQMQSASIATLGRLIFEFNDEIESKTIKELVRTVLFTMSFRNREITKAALGFIKVAVVCLDLETLRSLLDAIITHVLKYTKEHKSHFKSKARHLFERLIRKFSYEEVDRIFPDEDKKLITNIKKRREAAKKKVINSKKEAEEPKNKKFEEAFRDSESELGTDDEGDNGYIPEAFQDERKGNRKRETKALIRENGVVDFLDRNVVSQLSHGKEKKKKQVKDHFKMTSEGKLVLDEEEEDNDEDMNDKQVPEDYYKKSLQSEMSFTRGADGRVKFLKKNQIEEDVVMEDGKTDTKVGNRWNSNNSKKKEEKDLDFNKMLGRQYKAKKAKGDVKKKGMPDPHAYIPLSGKIVGNMNKTTKLDGTLKNVLKAAQRGTDIGVSKRSKERKKGINKVNKKHRK